MELITRENAQATFEAELKRANGIIPAKQWRHVPCFSLGFTTRKTAYGIASNRGTIFINECFIGLDTWEKLRETLRHEIAHLIAGVHCRHDSRWLSVFNRINTDCARDKVAAEAMKVCEQIKPKWSLIAHFVHGKSLVVGHYHRRDTKKAKALPNQYSVVIDGAQHKVVKFEYVENKGSK